MFRNFSRGSNVVVTIMMVTMMKAMMFDNDGDLIYKSIELANKYLD
jgi:hypothetical protein